MNTCLIRGLTPIKGLHRLRNNDRCSLQLVCRKANGRVLDGQGNPANIGSRRGWVSQPIRCRTVIGARVTAYGVCLLLAITKEGCSRMSQTVSLQLIEGLRRFDSATIANAFEHFEVRDPTMEYANNELVCQMPEIAAPMVGHALTVTADTTTPGDRRRSRVDDLVETIDAAPKPSVLVI